MNTAKIGATGQRVGGAAALYLAMALLAAMPYFLLAVDYPSAVTAADKVALVTANYSSMYAMYIATYVAFGIALAVLALALHERTAVGAPFMARVAMAIGMLWAFALIASGLVFTFGMTTVVSLAGSDRAAAVQTWQVLEPVAQALGGAGGELLGGLWVLTVSWLALRVRSLPRPLAWLGVAIGTVGVVSIVPPVHDAAYAFGLLQIVWLAWLSVVLWRTNRLEAASDAVGGALRVGAGSPMGRLRPTSRALGS